jgi:hypothetical protein
MEVTAEVRGFTSSERLLFDELVSQWSVTLGSETVDEDV